jgi:dimethylargininase
VSLIAIIRGVSSSINQCELSFHPRQLIDAGRAVAQHKAYADCLAELGAQIVSLPAEPQLPDAVFVEDTAVVLEEIAIIPHMGVVSRRPEVAGVASALRHYRPLKFLNEPATLDGGDVLRIGRTIFVGLSRRTNREGIDQLRQVVSDYGYRVQSIEVRGCLHLKSACSYIGNNTILLHRPWIETERLREFQLFDVAGDESGAANALLLNDVVVMPASFPRTRSAIEKEGFRVRTIDVSELQKAEAGVTCCSLIFASDDLVARTA